MSYWISKAINKMKKLLITAPSFSGYVEVVYGIKNELLTLDFASAGIEANQVNYINYERTKRIC